MLDIKLMAHPSRAEHVQKMLNQLGLPDSIVVWDDRPQGGDAMYTARKAWSLPLVENCAHRLVLQDDVLLCDNFISIVERISQAHPNCAISLINFNKEIPPNYDIPYHWTTYLPGCAIMLPQQVISSFLNWTPTKEKWLPHDDWCITDFCSHNRIQMICTKPSIVQHLDGKSLLPYEYDWKRVATDFEQSPQANWENKKIGRII